MADAERTLTKKGETTRDRIVEAARTMLLDRGYDGLVLRELADSLDIKLGNLQYYFPTREALALHVLGIEGTRDAHFIEEQRRSASPLETFRMSIRDMTTQYRSDSGRLLLMIAALAQHNVEFEQLYRDSYAAFYPVFESLLSEMKPDLPAAEVAARARIINALVEGSSMQIDVGDLDRYVDRVLTDAETIALA